MGLAALSVAAAAQPDDRYDRQRDRLAQPAEEKNGKNRKKERTGKQGR